MLEIVGKSQNYDWGTLGKTSKVAFLSSRNNVKKDGDDELPFAELWMGTHPSGPSTLKIDGTMLKNHVNLKTLGPKINEKFNGELPFLLKVLSIRKALSIQAHPDKILAASLHANFPEIYKDANHKPEMAVALTKFEAFIGFRPLEEIAAHLKEYPELSSLVNNTTLEIKASIEENKKSLKALFTLLQTAPQSAITTAIQTLTTRIKDSPTHLHQLLLRLNTQFPNDVGTFCALLLNFVLLEPGEAIFLAANEPHAYLSGDCIECMAASDNVVRSGLTPKFKVSLYLIQDVSTLISMLTYTHGTADSQILRGTTFPDTLHTVEYNPPIDEFSILRTGLEAGETETFGGFSGPSVLIVTDGEGCVRADDDGVDVEVGAGSIFFLGVDVGLKIETQNGLTMYRAFCV